MKPLDCGGCTKCCIRDPVPLAPDEVAAFEHERWNGIDILQRGPSGSCVYLAEDGCSIHGRAPKACRVFDCRLRALKVAEMPPYEIGRRLANPDIRECIAEGIQRLQQDAPKKFRRILSLADRLEIH